MKIWKYSSVKLATLACILSSLFEILMSYSLALLIVESKDQLYLNLLIISGIYLLNAVFMFLNLRSQAVAEYFVALDIKQRLDKSIANSSYESYHEKDYGERLAIYSDDVNKVLDLTLKKYLSMVEKLSSVLFILLALSTVHYSMVILAILLMLAMLFIPSLFQKALSSHIQKTQSAKEKYVSKMREFLQAFDTYLENSAFSLFLSKSREAAGDYAQTSLKVNQFTGFMSAALTLVNSMVSLIALALVAYLVLTGRVEVGMLLVVTNLLPNFGASVMSFLSEREFYKSGLDLY